MTDSTKTGLYEVTDGDAYYWVAAPSGERAIGQVRRYERLECGLHDDEMGVLEFRFLSEEDARKLDFYDPDTEGPHSMWDEYARDRTPRILACSEF